MADVYDFVEATGVILPDTSDLKDGVEAEFRVAFGEDISLAPETPQGVLVATETQARDNVARTNADLANQINPNLAGGVFLDALWALLGGARVRATPTLVSGVALVGAPNAIIPAGAQARVGAEGAIFETTGTVQLDATGSASADFQALEDGPTTVAIGALDTIVSGVLGWEGVSNPVAGEPGKMGESDAAARRRRRQTLGLQSVGMPTSILAALYDTEGVRSVAFRENYTSAPVVVDTVTIAAHGMYACVEGGTDLDVATSIHRSKGLGADMTGTTTVDVTDAASGQVYAIKFQRPADVAVYARVTVRQGAVTGDAAGLVKTALAAYAAGEVEGEDGFTVGGDVSPWELAGAVVAQVPGLFVQEVVIGTAPGTLAADVIPITIAQIAKMPSGNITVVVNP